MWEIGRCCIHAADTGRFYPYATPLFIIDIIPIGGISVNDLPAFSFFEKAKKVLDNCIVRGYNKRVLFEPPV